MLKNNIYVAGQIYLGEERFPTTPVGGFSRVVGTLVVIEPTPVSENLSIMPTDAWLLHNSNKLNTINEKHLIQVIIYLLVTMCKIDPWKLSIFMVRVLIRVSYNIKKTDVFCLKRIKFLWQTKELAHFLIGLEYRPRSLN